MHFEPHLEQCNLSADGGVYHHVDQVQLLGCRTVRHNQIAF